MGGRVAVPPGRSRALVLCSRETLEQGLDFCRRKQRADGSWEG